MKDKKYIILIVVIILMMIGMSIAESNKPKPLDWSPTFINSKTDPYGTYIAYQLLGDIFDKNNIRSTRRPIYNNLKKNVDDYFGYDESYAYNDGDGDDSSSVEDQELRDSIIVLVEAGDTLSAVDLYKKHTGTGLYEAKRYVDNLAKWLDAAKADPSAWYRDLESLNDTTSYIFINRTFSVDKLDLEYLLDFVGLGNDVFISAESFSKNLLDTLKIKVDGVKQPSDTIFSLVDSPGKKYSFGSIYSQMKLTSEKDSRFAVRALGFNAKWDTVFVEVNYGKGRFYLHTLPSAFANISQLQIDKYDFAFRSLSYLPKNSKIVWDEYQKQGAIGENSEFRVIFDSIPLRIAFYIVIIGLLLFMIFRAKRTQRAIPVINPPVNSSLEFLSTISNLYYRKKDFKDIAEKRHAYFLDFIRKNYYLSTENINDEFVTVLSSKSGLEVEKLNNLFLLYEDIATLVYISNDTFLKYNSLLEEFYKKAKNK
ncbi:DUF4350 domain-containing protein [Dysgonomonas sp.]